MRILSVNKFYFRYGGTERYLFDLNRLLQERGHKIAPFAIKNSANRPSFYERYFVSEVDFNQLNSLKAKIKAAARIVYSVEAKKKIEILIKKFRPHIAHLHNIAHQLSPSILTSLSKYNIPIIQTLHDYKLICPSYTMFSGGQVCERCLGGHYYRAALHSCKNSSSVKSLVNVIEMYVAAAKRLYDNVDIFIAPSEFLRNKMIEGGLDQERIIHIPYFLHLEEYSPRYNHDGYLLYMGQLISVEGVDILLKSLRSFANLPLVIAGRGPESEKLKTLAKQYNLDVKFVGFQSGAQLRRLVQGCLAVVVPSRWYENQPFAILEAFAYGKIAIGARIGGIAENIEDEFDGLLFEPGSSEDLANRIEWLMSNEHEVPKMGQRARLKVEQQLSPDRHYQRIHRIYRRLLR